MPCRSCFGALGRVVYRLHGTAAHWCEECSKLDGREFERIEGVAPELELEDIEPCKGCKQRDESQLEDMESNDGYPWPYCYDCDPDTEPPDDGPEPPDRFKQLGRTIDEAIDKKARAGLERLRAKLGLGPLGEE